MAEKEERSPECPSRVEGWLNVWEVAHRNERCNLEAGNVPTPIYEPCYCVLLQDCQRLSHFRTEKQAEETYKPLDSSLPLVRVDDGKENFDKRWGYLTLDSIKENVMQHDYSSLTSLETVQQAQHRSFMLDSQSLSSQCSDSAYEKNGTLRERRGSVPIVCGDPEDTVDAPSTPSRIASFFSKKVRTNLKRTKSVTKLDRRKIGYNNDLEGALINHRIRASRSHESLLQINTPSSMHSIDLSAQDIEIKPLHSSILGQEHCFQVSTSNGSKFYSCRSAEERQRWIQHLRKTVHPEQEMTRRTENSLKIWILEAKNLPPKKRYFCELCLDGTLYARTSSKTKGEMLFWGEQFDFTNLPPVKVITVNLYKEADKKKKKDKNMLLAYINIMVEDVSKRQLVEKWHTANSAIVGKAGKDNKSDQPLLRIKARYQMVNILPMDHYQELLQYIETEYCALVDILEPQISVKAKEELATTLVSILQHRGLARDFLGDIVMAEVNKLENEHLTFRGNSIATKAMEAYLKLVGDKYLQDTLGDFVRTMVESGDDCEVDPVKIQNNGIVQKQQRNLTMYCEMAWFKIVNSHCFFPRDLRDVFSHLRESCDEQKRGDLADNLISSCIFLRFLCPSILSPSLFNLIQEFPDERSARNLTLIAKTIQCLGNFTTFGMKEDYMTFMNDFVENELPNANNFINQISRPDPRDVPVEFDGYIDIGKELSTLHSLLLECFTKVNSAACVKLSKLHDILDDITTALENPQMSRRNPLNSSRGIYDNVPQQSPPDQNANVEADVVLTDVLPDYHGNGDPPSVDTKQVLDGTKLYSESVYSLEGRVRAGVTEVGPMFHSTEDYVRYTRLDETPALTHQQPVSPSTYTSQRPEEKQVNRCWSRMVRAAEMVNGDRVDLITFVDEGEDLQNSSLDSADQGSISQMSTIASSGYQSIGYSQSSSPVEPVPPSGGGFSDQLPLSFSNPLFGAPVAGTPVAGKVAESVFRSPPQDTVYRSPSCSSLSSDDCVVTRSTPSHPPPTNGCATYPSHGHQSAAVERGGATERAGAARSLDRRLRTGSSSSTDSVPTDKHPRLHRQCATHRPYTSPRQPRLASQSGSTTSELSRSVEFQPADYHSPSMRRTADTVIAHSSATPPQSPHFGTLPPTWRTPSQNTAVRMGVRSVGGQRQPQAQVTEQQTQAHYEQELTLLRTQLAETQHMLAETQRRLCEEGDDRRRLRTNMDGVLEVTQQSVQDQAAVKDDHIHAVVARFATTEEIRRAEQQKLQAEVSHKQHLIDTQDRKIQALDVANIKLMSALSQLKDRHHSPSQNGITASAPSLPLRPKLPLDDEELRQSSC